MVDDDRFGLLSLSPESGVGLLIQLQRPRHPLGYGLTYKTAEVPTEPSDSGLLGDVDDDGDADATDASLLLVGVTLKGVGKDSGLTPDQEARVDIRHIERMPRETRGISACKKTPFSRKRAKVG